MANVFFKIWKNASMVFLTVVFLFCYATLPDNIAIGFADNAEPNNFITKQQFFYWAGGTILGINLLFRILENALAKLDFKNLLVENSWGRNPNALMSLLKGWFAAILAFINTYLVFVLVGLYKINAEQEQKLDFNYNYILWIGMLILLIIFIFLPYKLLATQPSDED